MPGQALETGLLPEAGWSGAPSELTSARLPEPSEDEANAGHLALTCHGKFTDACETFTQI